MLHPGRSSNSHSAIRCFAIAILAAQFGLDRTAVGQPAPAAVSAPRVDPAKSPNDIGRELANPIGKLFSISNEIEYLSYQGYINGASDHPRGDFVIKPSFPLQLKNGKTLVIRASIPTNFGEPSYPAFYQDFADWRIRQFAYLLPDEGTLHLDHGFLDDISLDVAYGDVNDNGFITMFGVAAVLPSSQDGTGERDQYLLGPEVALGKVTSWGLVGAWATHQINVAEAGHKVPAYDTSITSLKLFFSYGLRNGWQLISNPLIEYDWEALPDNKLMLPIGGGVAKTTSIGNMPLRLNLEIYNYIKSPAAFGPDWLIRFGVTPVIKDRSLR
jgi:hypothetical protein